jgi:tetratricopeptide (TPR) repeat protein
MKVALYGSDHAQLASTLMTLGSLYEKTKKYKDAERYYLRGVEIYTKAAGDAHPRSILSLSALGQFYETTGKASKAISYLERAIHGHGDVPVGKRAKDQFALIRAYWHTSRRNEARERAARLLQELENAPNPQGLAKQVQDWVDTH